MKHLRLIILRELDHFRGWLLLLLGMVGLVILMHVLVLTIMPGERLAEYLVILKSRVVPGLFGLICALMGYADSPERGSHEFRARPVRVKMLYFGKIVMIVVMAGGLVLVQSLMNWFVGFPLSFWVLWGPLFLMGLGCFFLAAILKLKVSSIVQLMVVLFVPLFLFWISTMTFWVQEKVEIYPAGIHSMIFVFACYSFLIFLGRNFVWSKVFWFLLFPILAVLAAGMPWLLPFDQRVVEVDEDLAGRLSPKLHFVNDDEWLVTHGGQGIRRAGDGSGGYQLNVSEVRTDETVLQHLLFRNRVIELKSGGRIVREVLHFPSRSYDYSYREDSDILRAVGMIPALTQEEIAYQSRNPQWTWSERRWETIPIPPEMVGKEIEVRTEGLAYYRETRFLGALDIREGVEVSSDDLTVKIVKVDRLRNYLVLRVHSRTGSRIRLGAYQKNLRRSYHPLGLTEELTGRDAVRGKSEVDIVKVRLRLDQIDESGEENVLHLFSVIDRGSIPFQSEPLTLEPKDTMSGGRPTTEPEALYPVLPSITPFEKK